jgi:heptosyltransferase-2
MPTYSTISESSSHPSKILLVRFSSIGDIVFATAAIEAISIKYPKCQIHFLTLDKFSSLLKGHPSLFRVIPHRTGSFERERLKSLALSLELEGYDLVLDLHDSLRTKYLHYLMKSVNWKTLRKQRMKRLLQFYFHINLFSPDFDSILTFLRDENITNVKTLPSLNVTTEEKLRMREELDRKGVREKYTVLIPSAAWESKIWPAKNYQKLSELMTCNSGNSVVVLGGSKDTICSEISKGIEGVISLQGDTNLREAMAVLSLAEKAIGSDTGLLHAAEALDTPVVLISGPTGNSTGCKVRKSESRLVRKDLWCQPCSKSGSRPCFRSDRYCLKGICVENVWQSAN